MSEANADSASPGQEQPAAADSAVDGQEQGEQSRINGLMGLAQKRTSERDAALAEVEALRAQLEAHTLAEQSSMEGQSQIEAMYPERLAAAPPDDFDPMEQPEPPVIHMGINPARPDHAPRPVSRTQPSTPATRYAADQAEISAMKTQLNAMGLQWYEAARESGLIHD